MYMKGSPGCHRDHLFPRPPAPPPTLMAQKGPRCVHCVPRAHRRILAANLLLRPCAGCDSELTAEAAGKSSAASLDTQSCCCLGNCVVSCPGLKSVMCLPWRKSVLFSPSAWGITTRGTESRDWLPFPQQGPSRRPHISCWELGSNTAAQAESTPLGRERAHDFILAPFF